jgi:hypothetical protein
MKQDNVLDELDAHFKNLADHYKNKVMKKVVVNTFSSAIECVADALKLSGLDEKKVEILSWSKSYTEPSNTKGLNWNQICSIPRECKVTITYCEDK